MKNKEIIIRLSKELAKELTIASRDTYETVKPVVVKELKAASSKTAAFLRQSAAFVHQRGCQYWQHPISPFLRNCSGKGCKQLHLHYRKLAAGAALVAMVVGTGVLLKNFQWDTRSAASQDTLSVQLLPTPADKDADNKSADTPRNKNLEIEPASAAVKNRVVKNNPSISKKSSTASSSAGDGIIGLTFGNRTSIDLGMDGGYKRQMQRARYQAQQSSNRAMRRYQSHLNSTLRARGAR